MLKNEEIIAKVENAFSPLRCVAEIWDYDSKLRFKVFDENDNGIIEMPKAVLSNMRDKKELESLLQQYHSLLQDKGFI